MTKVKKNNNHRIIKYNTKRLKYYKLLIVMSMMFSNKMDYYNGCTIGSQNNIFGEYVARIRRLKTNKIKSTADRKMYYKIRTIQQFFDFCGVDTIITYEAFKKKITSFNVVDKHFTLSCLYGIYKQYCNAIFRKMF